MFGLQPPPSHSAPFFELDPMRYEMTNAYGGRSQGGTSLCLIAGIAVLLVYMAVNNAPSCRMMHFPADMAPRAHAMVSNVAAMAAQTVKVTMEAAKDTAEGVAESMANSVIVDAKAEMPQQIDKSNVALAITAKTSDKKKVDKDIREWLAKNSDGMLVIFASWCPHCKTLMERVGRDVKPSSYPKILFVDGDKWRDIFSGENALCKVEYFPQVMKMSENSSGLEAVTGDVVAELGSDKVLDAGDADKKATEQMLHMLF